MKIFVAIIDFERKSLFVPVLFLWRKYDAGGGEILKCITLTLINLRLNVEVN